MSQRALLTPAAMAAADARTLKAGTSHGTLVERAARACFRVLRSRYPRGPVTVLTGPGSNGEDGLVLALLLLDAHWPVEVMRLHNDQPLDDVRFGSIKTCLRPTGVFSPEAGHLVVDALFGAGLSKPLEGEAEALTKRTIKSGAKVLAIDLPSGVDGTSGAMRGEHAMRADATVTFHRLKPGHLLGDGADRCGALFLADIGVGHDGDDVSALWNAPVLWHDCLNPHGRDVHKYARGHVAVIGGPGLKGGAGRLAARAASVSGAGAVTHFSPLSAAEFAAHAFDAVMVRALAPDDDLAAQLQDRFSAVIIGPGMGKSQAARARLETVLASGLPCVIDADALTLYEHKPQDLFDQLHEGCVLTPHEGEFARLFGDLTGGQWHRAVEAAERCGATLVLKGSSTVIASPGSLPMISTNGSRVLATAGSGDCLAGVIGAQLAQGLAPVPAAAAGVWMHAEAGRCAAPSLNADALPSKIAAVYGALTG